MDSQGRDHELSPEYHEHHRVVADVGLLHDASRRLRGVGWIWFLIFSVTIVLFLMLIGAGQLQAVGPTLLGGLILLGISLFYFNLARHVQRGRRWAIGVSLAIVGIIAGALLWRIFTPRPLRLALAIMETAYLIATLNLLKALILSWGAARRLQQQGDLAPLAQTLLEQKE